MGEKTRLIFVAMNLSLWVVFPLVLMLGMRVRQRGSARLLKSETETKERSTQYTINILNNFYLLADYSKRAQAVDKFAETIGAFNEATATYNAGMTNNKFIPAALVVVVNAAWMFGGGIMLMETDELDLGTFLANLGIFKQIGTCWGAIYQNVLSMQECAMPLRTITTLMNLPTEDHDQRAFVQHCDGMARELVEAMPNKNDSSCKAPAVDSLPIKFSKLTHSFDGREVFSSISLTLAQGNLHVVRGLRGSGTTTLLQLAGRRILQNSGSDGGHLFIPLHLKTLHVSKEPLFVYGSLYHNLTYGVPHGNVDGQLQRVLAICRRIGLLEHVLTKVSDEPTAKKDNWNDVLSISERYLLNMARGLICNPEVLVIHKPATGLGPKTIPIVFEALKQFVGQRGLELNISNYYFRRPRTCIISAVSEDDFEYADVVHQPFAVQPSMDHLTPEPLKIQPPVESFSI